VAIRPLALSALTVLLLVTACGATPVARPVNSAAPATVARAAERASWQQLPLVDARTGESFTLADFAGKTVYVEPMATWCTNCRQQLRTVRDVYTQLDAERYAFVGLSVETDLPREQLASYAEAQGWPWRFAVMTPELLQELSGTFGLTVANPPATPHFLIGPDGSTSALSTGFHSAETLLRDLSATAGS
jgi:cytochrome oxidase Cu insertion factor (SCO1/SenC/PrrC family)